MKLKDKNFKGLILAISVVIPSLVAFLFFLPKSNEEIEGIMFLPKLNAILNGSTSIILILAFIAIRKGNRKLHERLILTALSLSVLFLLSYVCYHSLAESTHFGGEGLIKTVYFSILISHIVLAVLIVPLVLISLSRALSEKFTAHKKIARITLPIWLYVGITGVVVYLMISPYY